MGHHPTHIKLNILYLHLLLRKKEHLQWSSLSPSNLHVKFCSINKAYELFTTYWSNKPIPLLVKHSKGLPNFILDVSVIKISNNWTIKWNFEMIQSLTLSWARQTHWSWCHRPRPGQWHSPSPSAPRLLVPIQMFSSPGQIPPLLLSLPRLCQRRRKCLCIPSAPLEGVLLRSKNPNCANTSSGHLIILNYKRLCLCVSHVM